MSRQILINEIHKLRSEKFEKERAILDEVYIFRNYPFIESLFEYYKLPDERWHQLAREVLFFSDENTRYMYERTMQLIRRCCKDPGMYFEVKTEVGPYILPDLLSDLNTLLEMYNVFFCDIFPGLSRRLNLESLKEDHKGDIVCGKVNWQKTITDPHNTGSIESPLFFRVTRPLKSFKTPENALIILSALRMKYDSSFLLSTHFEDPLTPFEIGLLEKIVEGSNRALELPFFHELVPDVKKYVFRDLNDPAILALEAQVLSRTREISIQNQLMRKLLEWRVMYRELHVRINALRETHFPMDHIENIDKMYELWILFELVDFVRNEGATISIMKFPTEFKIEDGRNTYTIFYQKRYPGWSSVHAVPDFTIESDGAIKVILDAKNWLLDDKKEAIYKMLGYLNNLDASFGVLFFPTKKQLGTEILHCGDLSMKFHKSQWLFNCVLLPNGSADGQRQRIEKLRELFILIYDKLKASET